MDQRDRGSSPRIRYAILDGNYDRVVSPSTLTNPATISGDDYVSVSVAGDDQVVLTWSDVNGNTLIFLYYALVNGNGVVLTPPMTFYSISEGKASVATSYHGHGNTTRGMTPLQGTNGVIEFVTPPASVAPGEIATMTVRYDNYGPVTATGVTLTADLGTKLTYVSDTSGLTPVVSEAEGTVTWNIPDIDYLAGSEFSISIQTPPDTSGTSYPITFTLTIAEEDTDPANNAISGEITLMHKVYVPLIMKNYR